MSDRNADLRFTLKDLFILVALLGAALSAGRITGNPTNSIHLTLLVIGWIMYRFMHAHLAGLMFCLLGLDYLSARAIRWAYRASQDMFEPVFDVFATLLILTGVVIFLASFAIQQRTYWRWQLANAITFFLILIVWWFTIPILGQSAVAKRQARDTANNNAAMTQAVAQVESICQQLGHAPTEGGLQGLLTGGLPRVRGDFDERAIRYGRINDHHYQLSFTVGWGDINYYDSAQPQKGWQVEPF